jgi:uncharacterized pyridoxamine 5'-phosphate oxidase family protein/NAD-dependent dihydropyrimidine dehydrogenase PreA subunit
MLVYMNILTCFDKLKYIGVLAFATVDSDGAPQIRNISAIHYEENEIYFFTARGKSFCKELLRDGRVQVLGYTKYKEMIRLSGVASPAVDGEQKKWMEVIFKEQPYLANIYPGDTRSIGIIFHIQEVEIEYFNLGVNPIFRERYSLRNKVITEKGFVISDGCIQCGMCKSVCPQRCIEEGVPYLIVQEHCLHCGNCYEHCPVQAILNKN